MWLVCADVADEDGMCAVMGQVLASGGSRAWVGPSGADPWLLGEGEGERGHAHGLHYCLNI